MSNVLSAAKNTFFKKNLLINCRGKLIDLSTPQIMGILNLTPDSFFDGGNFESEQQILSHVEAMLKDGADIIDIGAISSRPGSDKVSESEEEKRLIPNLELIIKEFPDSVISVDTFRSGIAEKCLNIGASVINDIYGGTFDEKIFEVAAKYSTPFVVMHMQKNPKIMQDSPVYENVALEVVDFLMKQSTKAILAGVNDVIIDPGFGFGKTIEHNFQLLHHLDYFNKIFEFPLLIGVSRKSMISKLLNIETALTLNGTTAAHMLSLMQGASILRVHDVKEAKQTLTIFEETKKQDLCL